MVNIVPNYPTRIRNVNAQDEILHPQKPISRLILYIFDLIDYFHSHASVPIENDVQNIISDSNFKR